MIRSLIFQPMFSAADMLISTIAGVLALTGHFLATLPLLALYGALLFWARRKGWTRAVPLQVIRLARLNWQKYNGDKADEVVYQAEKMASAIERLEAALSQSGNTLALKSPEPGDGT